MLRFFIPLFLVLAVCVLFSSKAQAFDGIYSDQEEEILFYQTLYEDALSDNERDLLFREAQFCIQRYYYYLDFVDESVLLYAEGLKERAWKTALKCAFETMFIPTARAKSLACLLTIVNDVIDHGFKSHPDHHNVWKNCHICLARADAWMAKYDEIQNRLLMDE